MAKQGKFTELADSLVQNVGGRDNIEFITHCVTRLRVNVKEQNLVQKEKIEKIPGVIGCQWAGPQLQIIIGQEVQDAYRIICERNKLGDYTAKKTNTEGAEAAKQKLTPGALMDLIVGCLTPLIPILMAGGFLKIIVILGEQFGFLVNGAPTSVVLNFVGDAVFYFLPVFIGANAAQKFGANIGLGMLVGAMFIHPDFIAALAAGPLSVFGIPIYNASYSSSIFPVLLSVAVMAPVEKFIAKHSPEAIRSITEPFLTMLVMIPLSLCVLGPIGFFLGQYVSAAIIWLYNTIGFVGLAVFTTLAPFLIMTGMHHSLIPYMTNSFATVGWEPIVLPGMLISCIDQGSACFAVALKTKDKDLRATALGCGVSAYVGGITEPAMYGVTFKLKTPLYAAMFGSVFGGAVVGLTGASAYSLTASNGLLGGIPIYIAGGMSNVLGILAGIAVGAVISFVTTLIIYSDPVSEDIALKDKTVIEAPIPGKVVPLSEVPDQTFSTGMLGKGFAVEPSEGKVYAPFDGTCDMVFDTLHALGLTSDTGITILIHVGLETVGLGGAPFTAHVQAGDHIKKGQLLLEFQIDEIKAAGLHTITPVLVTNEAEAGKVTIINDTMIVGGTD
ncbi:glucose PTS transporter subunit IIA [Lachnospiraceae bacterium 47-T17]